MGNKTENEKKDATFPECSRCKSPMEPKYIQNPFSDDGAPMRISNTVCPGCAITEEAEESYRETQKVLMARFLGSRMGKLELKHSFESFKPEAGTRAAWRAFSNYSLSPKGFYIYGKKSGIGKSHLMAALAKKIMSEGASALWLFCPDFLYQLRERMAGRHVDREISIESAKRVEALFIDDIGAEKPSEWVRETLAVIIHHRLNAEMPTFYTSNCTIEELQALLGERIVSRIAGGCIPVAMSGTDHRKLG